MASAAWLRFHKSFGLVVDFGLFLIVSRRLEILYYSKYIILVIALVITKYLYSAEN